jgi:hypothetical protein
MHSHAQTSTEIDNNPIRYRPVSFSYSFSGNGAAKFSKKCLVSARVRATRAEITDDESHAFANQPSQNATAWQASH